MKRKQLHNQTDSQGRKQGPWEEHGKSFIEKGHYVDGLRQGLWKEYYKDGWGRIKLHSEGDYVDGLREGLWKDYDEDGDGLVWISGEGTYHNNLRQGVWKSYYWEGTIESEFHYKDDKMHGICKRFTENEPGEYEYSLYSKDKALISSFLLILPSGLTSSKNSHPRYIGHEKKTITQSNRLTRPQTRLLGRDRQIRLHRKRPLCR